MNGKVRPNGKQSRRSITHANSWSARLMRRLNDFLVMPPFRLETRLRTVHDGKRKTGRGGRSSSYRRCFASSRGLALL